MRQVVVQTDQGEKIAVLPEGASQAAVNRAIETTRARFALAPEGAPANGGPAGGGPPPTPVGGPPEAMTQGGFLSGDAFEAIPDAPLPRPPLEVQPAHTPQVLPRPSHGPVAAADQAAQFQGFLSLLPPDQQQVVLSHLAAPSLVSASGPLARTPVPPSGAELGTSFVSPEGPLARSPSLFMPPASNTVQPESLPAAVGSKLVSQMATTEEGLVRSLELGLRPLAMQGLPGAGRALMAVREAGDRLRQTGQRFQLTPELQRSLKETLSDMPVSQLLVSAAEGLPSLAPTIIATVYGGPAAGMMVGAMMEAGGSYAESEGRGSVLPSVEGGAMTAAAATGAINAALEYLPVGRNIERIFGPGQGVGIVRNLLQTAAEEGSTESVQEFVQRLNRKLFEAPDTALASPEAFEQYFRAGLAGAMGGAAAGAGGAAVRVPVARSQARASNREIEDLQRQRIAERTLTQPIEVPEKVEEVPAFLRRMSPKERAAWFRQVNKSPEDYSSVEQLWAAEFEKRAMAYGKKKPTPATQQALNQRTMRGSENRRRAEQGAAGTEGGLYSEPLEEVRERLGDYEPTEADLVDMVGKIRPREPGEQPPLGRETVAPPLARTAPPPPAQAPQRAAPGSEEWSQRVHAASAAMKAGDLDALGASEVIAGTIEVRPEWLEGYQSVPDRVAELQRSRQEPGPGRLPPQQPEAAPVPAEPDADKRSLEFVGTDRGDQYLTRMDETRRARRPRPGDRPIQAPEEPPKAEPAGQTYTDQVRAMKVRDDGRKVLSDMEEAIARMQDAAGVKRLVGRDAYMRPTDDRPIAGVGFSVLKPKDIATMRKLYRKASPETADRFDALVDDAVEANRLFKELYPKTPEYAGEPIDWAYGTKAAGKAVTAQPGQVIQAADRFDEAGVDEFETIRDEVEQDPEFYRATALDKLREQAKKEGVPSARWTARQYLEGSSAGEKAAAGDFLRETAPATFREYVEQEGHKWPENGRLASEIGKETAEKLQREFAELKQGAPVQPPKPKAPESPKGKTEPPAKPKAKPAQGAKVAEKLRNIATAMEKQVQEKLNPAVANQNVTERRSRIAAGMMEEGRRLQKVQGVARALADLHAAGTIPASLANVRTRTDIEELLKVEARDSVFTPRIHLHTSNVRDILELVKGQRGYKRLEDELRTRWRAATSGEEKWTIDLTDLRGDLAKVEKQWPQNRAVQRLAEEHKDLRRWEGMEITTEADMKQALSDLREILNGEVGAKAKATKEQIEKDQRRREVRLLHGQIKGFWQTPEAIAERMADDVQLDTYGGNPVVVEPNAGAGRLIDAVLEANPDATVYGIEQSPQLLEILREKYSDHPNVHIIEGDFLTARLPIGAESADVVVMNPPFEKGQDAEHIKHAWTYLAPGGRLAAIASEGLFSRQDAKAKDFRGWIKWLNASDQVLNPGEKLEGAFKKEGTGVASRLILLEKAAKGADTSSGGFVREAPQAKPKQPGEGRPKASGETHPGKPEGWIRLTDQAGNQARQAMENRAKEGVETSDRLRDEAATLQQQLDRTRRNAYKKRAELSAKVRAKMEAASNWLSKTREEREFARRAWLEDLVENQETDEANRRAALAELVEKHRTDSRRFPWARQDEPKLQWEEVKKLVAAEAEAQGAAGEDLEAITLDATSSLMAYPGVHTLVQHVEMVKARVENTSKAAELTRELSKLPGLTDYDLSRLGARLAVYDWKALEEGKKLSEERVAAEKKQAAEVAAKEAEAKAKLEEGRRQAQEAAAQARKAGEEHRASGKGLMRIGPDPIAGLSKKTAHQWERGVGTEPGSLRFAQGFLRRFMQAVPEYKANPVWTVVESSPRRGTGPWLHYSDGYQFYLLPETFNINSEALQAGDRVRIDPADWLEAKKAEYKSWHAGVRDMPRGFVASRLWGTPAAYYGGPTPSGLQAKMRGDVSNLTAQSLQTLVDLVEPIAGDEPLELAWQETANINPSQKESIEAVVFTDAGAADMDPMDAFPANQYWVAKNLVDFVQANVKGDLEWRAVFDEKQTPRGVVAYEDGDPVAVLAATSGEKVETAEHRSRSAYKAPKGATEKVFWNVLEAARESLQELQADGDAGGTSKVGKQGTRASSAPEASRSPDRYTAFGRNTPAPRADTRTAGEATPRSMIQKLRDKVGVPIRSGRTRWRGGAIGYYWIYQRMIRVKAPLDVETTAHEVGHDVQNTLGFQRVPPEVRALAYAGAKSKSREGFAEFFRAWLTNRPVALELAPNFSAEFAQRLESFPELRDAFDYVWEKWQAWHTTSSMKRVEGLIGGPVHQSWRNVVGFDALYSNTVDRFHPFQVLESRIEKELKRKLTPHESPLTNAWLTRGWARAAEQWLRYGRFQKTAEGIEFTGRSLREILAPIEKAGKLPQFDAYLLARRVTEDPRLMESYTAAGISGADFHQVVEEFGAQFEGAAEELQDYQDDLVEYLRASGRISQDQVERMKAKNPFYAPLYRIYEDAKDGQLFRPGTNRAKFGNVASPIRRVGGESRTVFSPVESILYNTYAVINAAERSRVGNAVRKIARLPKMGKYVWKIHQPMSPVSVPTDQVERWIEEHGQWRNTTYEHTVRQELEGDLKELAGSKTTEAAGKIEIRVLEALRARGYSEGEAAQLVARLKGATSEQAQAKVLEKTIMQVTVRTITQEFGGFAVDALTLWKPNYRTKGNEVVLYHKGKPEIYELDPWLYRAMTEMDAESVGMFAKILATPARILRAGATLAPEFAVRNPFRDQWTAYMQSRYGYKPGLDLVRGMWHVLRKDALWQEFNASGAAHAALVSLDRAKVRKSLTRLLKDKAIRTLANPFEALRAFSELTEEGTRVGEFARAIAAEGSGLDGVMRAGVAARDVTIDFSRMGLKTKAVNAIIAFWNARVQGVDKAIRSARDDFAGFFGRGFLSVTLPSLLLWAAQYDDKTYRDLPGWRKALFWNVVVYREDGRPIILSFPKPFELGMIFGSLPEAFLDWALAKDPRTGSDLAKQLWDGVSPGIMPTGLQLYNEWASGYSFFYERPTVPRSRQDYRSEYQYGPYTHEAIKGLASGMSRLPGIKKLANPAKIEALLFGLTGGSGRLALDLVDMGLDKIGLVDLAERPHKDWWEWVPGIRGFIGRYPARSTRIMEEFYQELDKWSRDDRTLRMLAGLEGSGIRTAKALPHFRLIKAHAAIKLFYEAADQLETGTGPYRGMDPKERRRRQDIAYQLAIETARQALGR